MTATAPGFEGWAGRLAAPAMAHLNRDVEVAAVEELDPAPGKQVLSIGFGPGVEIAELARRLPDDVVAGIDPSPVMVAGATKRNRAAGEAGRVDLRQAGAEAIPWPQGSFDGIIAVNSMQLWEPLAVALGEVARVMPPGGVVVTMTHGWAIEKRAPLEAWSGSVVTLLGEVGFGAVTSTTRVFRSGRGLILCATRAAHQR